MFANQAQQGNKVMKNNYRKVVKKTVPDFSEEHLLRPKNVEMYQIDFHRLNALQDDEVNFEDVEGREPS